MYIDRKIYYRQAHILVARQFIPNPDNKPIVNHKDENKMNPCVDNLVIIITFGIVGGRFLLGRAMHGYISGN